MASTAGSRLPSPLSDVRVVVGWLRTPEGARATRRSGAAFLVYLALVALLLMALQNLPVTKGSGDHGQLTGLGVALSIGSVLIEIIGAAAIFACVTLKARLIRMDQRLSVQHTAYYRARLEEEFARKDMLFIAEKTRWERERDEWKAKTQNEIYELVLDQVDRGVLGPRPKSRDGGTYDFPDRS